MPNRASKRDRKPKQEQPKGFRVPPSRTATLKFTGDYEGAVVVCSLDASVDAYLMFSKGLEVTDFQEIADVFTQFGRDLLLSWNIEDNDGNPMPATGNGMCRVATIFAKEIISAWIDALVGVAGPLVQPSKDGDTSEEE